MKKILVTLLALLVLMNALTATVYANSAQTHWRGVDSTGAMVVGENCPIEVTGEKLTFDIAEFPDDYYYDRETYLAYTGKVTAEYTFYNPTALTVTATLAFPFGKQPDYANVYDEESKTYLTNVDAEKYDVTVNGEAIEKRVRYTLSTDRQFILSEDLTRLSDTYVTDDFYSPDMTVTKYTYLVGGANREGLIDEEQYRAANVAFDWDGGDGRSRIYFPEQSGFHTQKDGDGRLSRWADNGDIFCVYVIGEPLPEAPVFTCYEDGGVDDREVIDGTVALTDTERMTLETFALTSWREDTGVLRVDWYNAVIWALIEGGQGNAKYNYIDMHYGAELSCDRFMTSLMRWYEYEITLAPGESLVNTVTAPIYPAVDMDYDPDIFTYTYLLSPAGTWADFGELEIVINTPFFLIEDSFGGFSETEGGYVMVHSGLPDGELTFTLCAEAEPDAPSRVLGALRVIALVLSVVGMFVGKLLVPILVVILIVLLVRRARKKRKE